MGLKTAIKDDRIFASEDYGRHGKTTHCTFRRYAAGGAV